jgi:hypothetical protein
LLAALCETGENLWAVGDAKQSISRCCGIRDAGTPGRGRQEPCALRLSMFDPEALRELLAMPESSRPVAILCLGWVDDFYPRPMLETQGWRERADLSELVFVDRWNAAGKP